MKVVQDNKGTRYLVPPDEIKSKPWAPTRVSVPVIYALQRMEKGEASAQDQTAVLKWITRDLCGIGDLSYRPESARETDFAEGKRFCGLQIERYIGINLKLYLEEENGQRTES